jgi:hypothetical protein
MGLGAESLITAQNHSKFIKKFATTFKGTVRQQVYIFIITHYPRPKPFMLESFPA